MVRRAVLGLLGLLAAAAAGQAGAQAVLKLRNPGALPRRDALVEVPAGLLGAHGPSSRSWRGLLDGEPVAVQAVDRDGDGRIETLALVADFAPRQVRRLSLTPGPSLEIAPRAQAVLHVQVGAKKVGETFQGGHFEQLRRLDVPADHTIHDNLIAMEGPGWESDKVGYRLYLDERDVTDVYGKKRPEPALHRIGLGHDDYHAEADWGMDVLKVGEALGAGGLGVMRGGMAEQLGPGSAISAAVEADGPLLAALRVDHQGWKLGAGRADLTARYAIAAGSRLTMVEARATEGAPIAAGLVKHPGVQVLRSRPGGRWAYVATWGPQAENKDDLGLALFYRTGEAQPGDDGRTLYVRFADPARIRYAFSAVWTKDDGIHDGAAFKADLDRTLAELDAPIRASDARTP